MAALFYLTYKGVGAIAHQLGAGDGCHLFLSKYFLVAFLFLLKQLLLGSCIIVNLT